MSIEWCNECKDKIEKQFIILIVYGHIKDENKFCYNCEKMFVEFIRNNSDSKLENV